MPMENNKENLEALIAELFGHQKSEQIAEDIVKGEQILDEHSCLEPDGQLIKAIKTRIAARLIQQKRIRTYKRIAYRIAAAAAVFAVFSAIAVKLLEQPQDSFKNSGYSSTMDKSVWENQAPAAEDAELVLLTAEIEHVEQELLAVQLGENGNGNYKAAGELEADFIEINSDFWKG